MDLKPTHLRTLTEVARAGTISGAAEALGYTPSALSQQIAALERTTGRQLLEPVGRTVRLTDAGRVLVDHAQRILGAFEEAAAALEATDTAIAGELRVGMFESVAAFLLPRVLDELTAYPDLQVNAEQIEPSSAAAAVAAGTLDAAFVLDFIPEQATRGLDHTPVCRDRFRIVVGRDDPLTGPTADLRVLEGRDLIVEAHDASGGGYVHRACRAAGFAPTVRHHLHDYPAILRLVQRGETVALVPDLGLAFVPPDVRIIDPTPGSHRDVDLVTRPSSTDRPAVAALIRAVHTAATDLGLDTGPRR